MLYFILEFFIDILAPLNLQLIEAKNGEEAWEIFNKEKIDIVITDVNMPGTLNGLMIADKIIQADFSVPVLLVTGSGEKDNMLKALHIGVSDFILKPFNTVFLRDRVERAIGKRKLMLGQIKIIELLQEMMSIPKDQLVEKMSVQERIDYIHDLVAIVTIKKEREV